MTQSIRFGLYSQPSGLPSLFGVGSIVVLITETFVSYKPSYRVKSRSTHTRRFLKSFWWSTNMIEREA